MSVDCRGIVQVILATALLAVSARSYAQSGDPAALVREGIALRAQGHDDEALARFRRAYEIDHRPIALGQMALAEQALGRWVLAEGHMREALAIANDSWVTRNHDALAQAYSVIEQHVGRLEVRGTPAGAEVVVNGDRVGTLPLNDGVAVLAGTATVEVRAAGRRAESRSVVVTAAQLSREQFDLREETTVAMGTAGATTPSSARPSTSALPQVGSSRTPLIAGALIGALVFGGVGLGLYLGPARQNEGQYNSMCAPNDPSSMCGDFARAATTANGFEITAFGVSALLVAAAAVLFVTRPASNRHVETALLRCIGAPALACGVRF